MSVVLCGPAFGVAMELGHVGCYSGTSLCRGWVGLLGVLQWSSAATGHMSVFMLPRTTIATLPSRSVLDV